VATSQSDESTGNKPPALGNFFSLANSARSKGNKLSDALSNGQWGLIHTRERKIMSTLLMIILVLLLVGVLPTWPYSSGWGYYPAGGLGLVLLITLVFLLFSGRTV
jgi:hypothetical protein